MHSQVGGSRARARSKCLAKMPSRGIEVAGLPAHYSKYLDVMYADATIGINQCWKIQIQRM